MPFISKIKQTFTLATPIVVGQMGVMLMGLADTIQVGQMKFQAAESLGASGMAGSIFFTIAVIGLICMSIVSPMISKAEAENDFSECGNLLKANIRVAIILALVTIFVIAIVAANYDLFDQTPLNKSLTLPFLALISFSILPLFLFSAFKSFTDGLQMPKIGMTITLFALLFNIGANQILINGIGNFNGLGLMGAGIATLTARIGMAVCLGFFVFKNKKFRAYLSPTHVHQSPWILEKTILKVGIPSGFQGFFEIATFGMAVVMTGWISVTAQAAHIIAINMASLTYMMATGIAAAGGIHVGADIGERNRSGIFISGNAALVLVTGFMTISALIMYFGKDILVRGYTKEVDVTIIAVSLVTWGAIFQLFDGIQAVSLGLLRGLQDVRMPTLITIVSYWGVGIPLSYLLGIKGDLGAVGIWIGLTGSLVCSSILLSWRFYVRASRVKFEDLEIE